MSRREFDLPKEDVEFLEDSIYEWEAVCEGNVKRVVLKDYPLPAGYSILKSDIYFRIEPAYPDSQIDMAYFYPALSRVDGKAIRAIVDDSFDGKIWQRWSRHRTAQNPWRPGVDCIETHLVAMEGWLKQELLK